MKTILYSTALACCLLAGHAAANPATLAYYQQLARQENPAFGGFSAERGRAFYSRQSSASGKAMSCAMLFAHWSLLPRRRRRVSRI